MPTEGKSGRKADPEALGFRPEIVIGFVAPTGVRHSQVKPVVTRRLESYGYVSTEVHLSLLLDQINRVEGELETERIHRLQTLGNSIRKKSKTGAALAHLAVMGITAERAEWQMSRDQEQSGQVQQKADTDSADSSVNPTPASASTGTPGPCPCCGRSPEARPPIPHGSCAYLVWSLKRADEIEFLRTIYGSRFYLFSLFAPRADRIEWLADKTLTSSRGSLDKDQCRDKARSVIDRDQSEDDELGQEVRKAYPMADFLIDARDTELEKSVTRAIDLIFGVPFETPTRDEFGMAIAHTASLQSAEPGRQVGAAILSDKGDVVATGTNEVPAYGGGHYWTSDPTSDDHREFRFSDIDTSDKEKGRIADQVWKQIKPGEKTPPARQVYAYFEKTGLDAVTEFGRAVHGEMGTLMDGARRGVSVAGLTMYVTTFPCHQCTRHIISAGIRRLVYVYPYPKSRAKDLHGDSIDLEGTGGQKVRYESFLGVAPTSYARYFTMPKRKNDETGELEPVEKFDRVPRLPEGRDEGMWDGLGYLESEKRSNEACEKWRDDAFNSIRASSGTKLDSPTNPPLSTVADEEVSPKEVPGGAS